MIPINTVVCTNHAMARYIQHVGPTDTVNLDMQNLVRHAVPVTKKSTAWYAPLVRQQVKPGASFFFHEGRNLVIVAEHRTSGELRVITLYPLHAMGFTLTPERMRSLRHHFRRETVRQNSRTGV